MTERLRRRKVRVEDDPTPEFAAEVIKQYFLPMFQQDNRSLIGKARVEQFGLKK
jgi:hypothetical protein